MSVPAQIYEQNKSTDGILQVWAASKKSKESLMIVTHQNRIIHSMYSFSCQPAIGKVLITLAAILPLRKMNQSGQVT